MGDYNKSGLKTGRKHTFLFINETHIHIRCVDEDKKPLKGRHYAIQLPDRDGEIKGQLDKDGWAKHDKIKPGECTFRLLTPDEVKKLGEDENKLHFVNIVVNDEEGRPLDGDEYVLVLPDGSTRKGKLDKDGRALEEKIPPGPVFFALKGKGPSGVTRHLRLQFLDEDGDPFAQLPFEIKVGTHIIKGTTNDEGRVIADIPGADDDGELTIWVDEDQSGESFTWPIKISEIAT